LSFTYHYGNGIRQKTVEKLLEDNYAYDDVVLVKLQYRPVNRFKLTRHGTVAKNAVRMAIVSSRDRIAPMRRWWAQADVLTEVSAFRRRWIKMGDLLRRVGRIVSNLVLALLIAIATAWTSLALWYRFPALESIRGLVAGLFVLVGVATIVALFDRVRWRALVCFIGAFGAVLVWWTTITAEGHADWAPDVSRQVTGSVDGDLLTLTNVRDFEWHGDHDFMERWTSRTYDLTKLRTLDLFMSYWAGPQMAHTIMSFGFEGGDYLAWSIEVRRLKGGEYSPIADLFKSSPLVIIAADERDIVRLRTNIRHEDVQLYRLRASPQKARPLLLGYVADANALAESPRFYNSITTNCTTTIVKMMRAIGDTMPFNWRFIVNGYLPDYAYQRGALDTRTPFAKLKTLAHIDQRASAADNSPDFSRLIRVDVPSPLEPKTP
jgi:uncharacterized protein DUF4105